MDKYIIKNGVETDGDIEVDVLWIEDKNTKEIVASTSYKNIADKILEMLNNGELEVK